MATEVSPGLFVGSGTDLILADDGNGGVAKGWFVVSAAKDPWHREAIGYTSRAAPKDSPEYLVARRERRIILNLIDPTDKAYIPAELVSAALEAITAAREAGNRVLVHCNQGQSRAPMLALLWLRFEGAPLVRAALRALSFDQALAAMREAYPAFAPGDGIAGFARDIWETAEDA